MLRFLGLKGKEATIELRRPIDPQQVITPIRVAWIQGGACSAEVPEIDDACKTAQTRLEAPRTSSGPVFGAKVYVDKVDSAPH